MYNWINLQVCYNNHVNLYRFYSFFIYLFFIYFLCIPEGKKQMVVVVCEERETIKKIKFFWYFNKIYKIDNMMWSVLKSEDVKKKKVLMLK